AGGRGQAVPAAGRGQGAGGVCLVPHLDRVRGGVDRQQQPAGPEDRPAGRRHALAAAVGAGDRRAGRCGGDSAGDGSAAAHVRLPRGAGRRSGACACRTTGWPDRGAGAGRDHRQRAMGHDRPGRRHRRGEHHPRRSARAGEEGRAAPAAAGGGAWHLPADFDHADGGGRRAGRRMVRSARRARAETGSHPPAGRAAGLGPDRRRKPAGGHFRGRGGFQRQRLPDRAGGQGLRDTGDLDRRRGVRGDGRRAVPLDHAHGANCLRCRVKQVEIEQVPAGADALAVAPSQRAMVLRRLAGPLLSVGMLCLALWALHLLAREVNYHQVRRYVQSLSHARLLLAALFTLLGYAVMTLYDRFALAAIGRRLSWQRITLISFISYALGMSLLVSGSIRYRFYVQNGLGAGEIARVVLFCTTSFWLGLLALTGVTLLCVPLPPELPFAALSQPLGAALLALPLAWLLGGLVRRPLRIWRWRVALPSMSTALKQILVGAFDWGLAAAVLYVLMPDELNNGFGHFLAIFVIAQIIGLISHVPGGLGVFEAVMLAGFGATGNAQLTAPILGALAAFRVIYYLLPLCTATVLVLQREARGLRRQSLLAPWFTGLLPSFFAGLTLVCGAVLLFSGATRALPVRMAILGELLPLSVLEVSHLLASVIGMLLLILARGLQRRLDAAYWLTLVLLLAGAVFSLLKGIDYEEAALMTLLALALAPAHRLFHRRASLFS